MPISTVNQNSVGTPVAGTGPAFSAYASAATSVPNGGFTKILFDTEEFDTNNNFSSSRFQPTIAGYYQIESGVVWESAVTGVGLININKNGTQFKRGTTLTFFAGINSSSNVVALVYMNGSTDYVEIYGFQNTGNTISTFTGSEYVFFQGVLVRAA
jgi:hypothetical protein